MTSRPIIGRRHFLMGSLASLSLPALASTGRAQSGPGPRRHGLSAFGELKYAADFSHFSYANPQAPNGGAFHFSPPNWAFNQNVQTFNTLNCFVQRGDAPPRMEMCFDSLMVRALDEPDAIYGLIAETVELSADGNRAIFHLREAARFQDGTPLGAEDVAFTYRLFKEKGHPSLLLPLTEMTEANVLDSQTVELVFSGRQSARTLLTAAQFPIVSQVFFTQYPFDSSEMRAPLGSGPYRVGRIVPGLSIEYVRVEDYWGSDLPVNRGLDHFDRVRIDFYRDRQAAFEAFKKGDIHYRQEFTAKTWATEYDFPAIQDKRVVRREFPGELRPSMQAWALNTRRTQFRDHRVREAISLCFDFEWTRRNLFYGAYERSHSLFEQSPYRAEGLPSPQERDLLASLPGEVPEAAFGEAILQPQSDGSGRDRKLLGRAVRLLGEAGWERHGNFFHDAAGKRLTVELMTNAPVFERIARPFLENMRAIGIDASIRMVDAAQYQARQNEYDFDMLMIASSFSATPTDNDLRQFFHSRAAELPGTRNLTGTADPAIDALIEHVGAAQDRDELTVAMRALDRILRARLEWIPNWHAGRHRAAYWDMFGFHEPKPDYGFPVERLWWYDAVKAKAIGRG